LPMIRFDIAFGPQDHAVNDNFRQPVTHGRNAARTSSADPRIYRSVAYRSPRCQRLASPTKQPRCSHSGTSGNRRNIGPRNLLHWPGLHSADQLRRARRGRAQTHSRSCTQGATGTR
jgi:hypothetical protein